MVVAVIAVAAVVLLAMIVAAIAVVSAIVRVAATLVAASVPAITVAVVLVGTAEARVGMPAIPFASARQAAMIAVAGIVIAIDITVEVAWAVEPWARTDEDPVAEPLGSVIAVGSAIVRRVWEVSVGANGRRADVDGDRELRLRFGSAEEEDSCNYGEGEEFDSQHISSFPDGALELVELLAITDALPMLLASS